VQRVDARHRSAPVFAGQHERRLALAAGLVQAELLGVHLPAALQRRLPYRGEYVPMPLVCASRQSVPHCEHLPGAVVAHAGGKTCGTHGCTGTGKGGGVGADGPAESVAGDDRSLKVWKYAKSGSTRRICATTSLVRCCYL